MNNYSINSQAAQIAAGDLLSTANINLTITADTGYTVLASDFSLGDANPDVDSVFFTDNGDGTVNALVIFAAGAIMPSNNKELLIDIDGVANPIQNQLSGTINVVTSNTALASTTIPYSISGDTGEEVLIDTITLTADTGYEYSDGTHSFIIDPTNDYPGNYRIEEVDTITTGSVTAIEVSIYYTFTNEDITGESIFITANAVEIFTPSSTYNSYLFFTEATQNGSGAYQYSYDPASLDIKVFGTEDASVTIELYDTTNAASIDSQTKLVGSGVNATEVRFTFDLPSTTIDTDYTITFSGDIDPGFSQANPININQKELDTIVTYSFTPVTGYNITQVPIPVSVSGVEGVVTPVEQINTTKNITYSITSTTPGNLVDLTSAADFLEDFSNADSALNGGTQFLVGVPLMSGEASETFIVTYAITVNYFGSSNITCNLDLSSKLTNTAP